MASVANLTATVVTPGDSLALRTLNDAILVDLTALRAALVAVTAKLDLDAGVSGTDYASTCNPAALTTTA